MAAAKAVETVNVIKKWQIKIEKAGHLFFFFLRYFNIICAKEFLNLIMFKLHFALTTHTSLAVLESKGFILVT